MSPRPDDDVDELLREPLPPAPASWVERAEEMPQLERALEGLDANADEQAAKSALRREGLEPDEDRLRALARLRGLRAAR